ncbi:phytanoyl-CoA dioxygenase family protein [Spongiactinospora sp. TRM90649]|uniref:phytanoyl-CoA dioxygenase family protein n=1 Tax=Spongiactinospora sp. TRM90649 TaxID=3031114 RepID=UPI0023F9AC57|nr:phytanoyl-CoA dioxygenase family protein [Spongiactinospora sp. TRM90649]MDF5756213.1 phytanoyl-CoA dioxygenase family protein [Spongiactinospora sp. TRM90649]
METDERDWTSLRTGERVRNLEIEGYVVLPGLLAEDEVRALGEAAGRIGLRRSGYTDRQWFAHDIQWDADPLITRTLGAGPAMDFLAALFDDDVICIGMTYSRSDPGYPGMVLHTDSHPYGSEQLGAKGTSPVIVRVLYYLDDLTPERAPLRVVPHSHLSLHRDAMPYRRYREHPEERQVLCRAGDAVVINHRVFHAAGPNTAGGSRRMLAASYRPAWARPVRRAAEYHATELARLAPELRPLFAEQNRGLADTALARWNDDLPGAAPGVGPLRWSRP